MKTKPQTKARTVKTKRFWTFTWINLYLPRNVYTCSYSDRRDAVSCWKACRPGDYLRSPIVAITLPLPVRGGRGRK